MRKQANELCKTVLRGVSNPAEAADSILNAMVTLGLGMMVNLARTVYFMKAIRVTTQIDLSSTTQEEELEILRQAVAIIYHFFEPKVIPENWVTTRGENYVVDEDYFEKYGWVIVMAITLSRTAIESGNNRVTLSTLDKTRMEDGFTEIYGNFGGGNHGITTVASIWVKVALEADFLGMLKIGLLGVQGKDEVVLMQGAAAQITQWAAVQVIRLVAMDLMEAKELVRRKGVRNSKMQSIHRE